MKFDLKYLEKLAKLMNESELTEMQLEDQEQSIVLKREKQTVTTNVVSTPVVEAKATTPAKVEEAKETVKEAAKATTKKVAAKKTAVRTTAKKAVAKKEVKTETFIQYNDEQTDMDAVLKRVEADLKAQKVAAKDIKLYIKPQDGACYYVADGKVAGRVDLF